MNDLDRYAVSLENMEVLRDQVEEQAREIAALKAQPSGVVLPIRADSVAAASGYHKGWNACIDEVARLNQPASAVWMMPTVKQLEHALESVPSFHDLSAELIAPAMLEHLREVISAGEYGDAYQGARQDLLIWKRRALESETKVREQDQVIENLGNALNAESGPIFMGEPVMPVSAGDERAALRYTSDGELAECPCCGSLDVGGANGTVSCYSCDLQMTKPRPLQNAADAWNKRAAPSAGSQEQG